jgi:DNA invertase Pin-like site-specific DNA recombinase
MLIGYARVSTADQNLDLQHDALARVGVEKVFEDKASGARDDRPGLRDALSHCRPGDVLVVYKLDRLGRTMRGLVELVADLAQRKIEFRSLSDGIDTTTTMGRFTFHLLGAIAEMERDLIRERTNAGLAAARARGRKGGRKTILTATKLDAARALLQDRNRSVGEVAKTAWRRAHHALPRARRALSRLAAG